MLKTPKLNLTQTAKGMHDILTKEYLGREKFIEKAKTIVEYYGFQPIHTPYLEKTELFTASLGETTDIVEKQMYTLKTRGGDKLVLRPEATASMVRAYLQHGMQTKPQPVMFYTDGFFFRHETPQKGRRREFQQFDIEILGEEDSIADAIIIKVCLLILEEAEVKPLRVHINSIGDKNCRKVYQKELTAYYRKKVKHLCKDCQKRLKINPLRLLDCKDEKCIAIKQQAPQMINYLCKECTNHFKDLLEILDVSEIPYYLDHYLVRGLDYYSRTVFEIFLDAPILSEGQNRESSISRPNRNDLGEIGKRPSLALASGGRYDSLAQILSKKGVAGVGAAIGVDRVIEILAEKQKLPVFKKPAKVFFVQLGLKAKQKSLSVLEMLRKAHIQVNHSLSKDSLKSQLRIAAKLKVAYALILGQKEAMDKNIIVRNMKSASQETISLSKLVDYLKKHI